MEQKNYELYSFKCNDCGFIYLEPYNPKDRFSEYPCCSDCESDNVDIYDGELEESLQKYICEYNKENGINEY